MEQKYIILISMLIPALPYAKGTQLIDERQIEQWGYYTLSHEKKLDDNATVMKQLIKSKKEAKGMENHFYYFTLSQICFMNSVAAQKRKSSLVVLEEKDYRLVALSEKCVLTINAIAKFATFKEQPRVFMLFKNHLNNKNK
jgi:hypothetical protein